ncbi:hypothetical protein G1C97_1293 [Bifidobacterium sp. DSM 109959]|uniref:Uncharacterized protein n=1 Tax=Bifidobacterium olomucense TaxID=2675324 RepID=A0A7Y0HWH7_9BIFI|nr:hypothetical protein [Bifidobacterium sp. DSM 109959]
MASPTGSHFLFGLPVLFLSSAKREIIVTSNDSIPFA